MVWLSMKVQTQQLKDITDPRSDCARDLQVYFVLQK